VNHVEECTTCIEGIDTRRTAICPLGFHLGKKVLVHVYQERGELYSTFDRDVNNDIVRLELDDTISDVRRIAQLLEIIMHCSQRND
jgi:DNA-directed RNA polymerase alpha subunit